MASKPGKCVSDDETPDAAMDDPVHLPKQRRELGFLPGPFSGSDSSSEREVMTNRPGISARSILTNLM